MILSLFNAGVRGVFLPSSGLPFPDRVPPLAQPRGTVLDSHPIHKDFVMRRPDSKSLKKRCNAFIPDFFGMHDMYLLVIAIYGHSR